MSSRSLLLAGALALAVVPAGRLFAQENVQQQPEVPNAKFQFEGAINAPAVFVRSGPGDGYYTTQKLDKGSPITVVGIKFDWLKIVPPEGSFCYVAKGFVERHGDGKIGRVIKPEVNVRAGSLINTMKTTVQSRLNVGDEVQIIDEVDEYFKIKPPTGAYLYVNKQFVDPVRSTVAVAPATDVTPGVTPGNNQPAAPNTSGGTIAGISPKPMIDPTAAAETPTTKPADVAIAPASTQPAELTAEEKFGNLETEYNALTGQPVSEQPVEELSKKYQAIAKADGLSDTLKRIVTIRIATLNSRAESKVKLASVKAEAKIAADKQTALLSEKEELEANLRKTKIEIFAAVGTLQPSSLQLGGGGTLYRLTDPANGRTVIYVRSNDNKLSAMVGQFIGVKGTPGNDPQLPLRIVTPTAVQKVDVASVTNNTVAAQIIPPSLIVHDGTPVSKAE